DPNDPNALVDHRLSTQFRTLRHFGVPALVPPVVPNPAVMLDRAPPITTRSTPPVADVTGDGVADVVVLSRAGDILVRQVVPGRPGVHLTPLVVNRALALPRAREVVVLAEGADARLAAVDVGQPTLSVYARSGGRWLRVQQLSAGDLPFRLAAGDVDGDG